MRSPTVPLNIQEFSASEHALGRHKETYQFWRLCPTCCDELNAIDEDLAAMTECRNCDKPISGGKYCSNRCEDMDRFPLPQDDQEKFTTSGGA